MSIFSYFKPISAALLPNIELDDIRLILGLFLPWNWDLWRTGEDIGRLEDRFREYFGVNYVIGFTSGRAGFYAILKGISELTGAKHSEIILQAYTTIALPIAIRQAGFTPVFVDIKKDTLNIDPDKIEKKITKNTRAIIVQHTFGAPAEMDRILEICKKNDLLLIEDCAHSLGAEYSGKKIGTFGSAAFFSFGRDKIISSTSGGMVIVKDEKLAQKIKDFQVNLGLPPVKWIFRQLMHPIVFWCALPIYYIFGIGKFKIFLAQKLGLISRAYSSEEKKGGDVRFSGYMFPNGLSILALNQFKKIERFNDHRREIAKIYENEFRSDVPGYGRDILVSSVLKKSKPVFLYYTIQIENRDELLKIGAKKHMIFGDWFPGALGPKGVKENNFGYKKGDCSIAEMAGHKSLNLPTNIQTSEKDAEKVANLIKRHVNFEKMEIKEITDKAQWDNFISIQKPDTFLQSWNWGKFNKSTGEKIWRLGIFDDGDLKGAALAVKINAKRGRFIFCPHLLTGDNWHLENNEIWNLLFDHLKALGVKENADFVRISPLAGNSLENLDVFRAYGFRDAPVHMMHPELSWILDISKSEDELMKGMRKTTRNLIRRAEREKVEIVEIKSIEGVEGFYDLLLETVGRHGFVPFSRDYLKKEFESFAPDGQISIYFAKHNGLVISSAIIVFYGGSAFYHHGASLASKIPGSYLLLWKIIQEGKKRGCRKFNFWGIAPDNKPKHPWAGLTLFKTGFGGYRQEYLHCQDLPITVKYWLNYAVEKIRRIKRGY